MSINEKKSLTIEETYLALEALFRKAFKEKHKNTGEQDYLIIARKLYDSQIGFYVNELLIKSLEVLVLETSLKELDLSDQMPSVGESK